MSRGHRQIDHTADLALELWAESEAGLLDEGARALVEILSEGAPIDETGVRQIELQTLDAADRLVQVLNEVLVLALTEGFLAARLEAELLDGGVRLKVAGDLDGARKLRAELKSVTYHDLVVEERGGGWYARVVIDV